MCRCRAPSRIARRGMVKLQREPSPGSLNRRQYHPGVWEGGFPSLNKGSGGRGCEAPPEVGCIAGGTSSPRLPSAEHSCDIRPSF
ncbi:hypothetical protein BHM03_00059956 [Ensete ventricosum]|nr:hypothetical protein BHM03_00059956 [Ensete ventricosum]